MSDSENYSPNKEILDEVNTSGGWFHAKKVRPIWAKIVVKDQFVATREGRESVSVGDFLCRGEALDVWPQKSKNLYSKYDPGDEVDGQGWRKFLPKPDDLGVFAAQVLHTFMLETSWGTIRGKAGDYLVKKYEDIGEAHPEDVWIVSKNIFASTYKRVSLS